LLFFATIAVKFYVQGTASVKERQDFVPGTENPQMLIPCNAISWLSNGKTVSER